MFNGEERQMGSLLWGARRGAAGIAAAVWGVALTAIFGSGDAGAVPSYARQTGQNCVACHISFPELTPYGRYFKLMGYTLGDRQSVPLAMMAELSYKKTANNTDANGNEINPRDGSPMFKDASLFLAGKATDWLGAFVQYTYDNTVYDTNTGANPPRSTSHSALDNTDIRLVGKYLAPGSQEPDLIYGLTIHNNPTVQDVWNSTPAFGYPFTGPPNVDATSAGPSTLVEGGLAQATVGTGLYLFWEKSLYAEFTNYHSASRGAWKLFATGQDTDTLPQLKSFNPYVRLAYERNWDSHSLMVGTFRLQTDIFPMDANGFNSISSGPTDRFVDQGFDAQYQYITDPHVVTAQATYIKEKQTLNATALGGPIQDPNNEGRLNSLKLKATYYYERKYGATIAYQRVTGQSDNVLYATNVGNVPDWSAWTYELNYVPIQNVRLMLQYTKYTKFNGGTDNYDGTGRNAKDNNVLFFNVWVAF
jgi:hypothetical protein